MSKTEMLTMSKEDLAEMMAKAASIAVEQDRKTRKDDGLIGVWRPDDKAKHGSIIIDKADLPDSDKFWLNIFPNDFWKAKKKKKGEQPKFKISIRKHTPKEAKK